MTPNNRFTLPALTRQSFGYFAPRAIVILGLSLLIAGVIVVRPYLPGRIGILAVMGVAGLCGLLLIGNLKRVLLAVILIDIPLRWDIYLGARVQNSPLGMREGWIISVTTMALAGLIFIYLGQELALRRKQPHIIFTENVPLLLYLAFTCLSAIFAVDTIGALFQIFFLAQVFVLYVYLSSTITSKGDILFIMVILMGTMLIEGGISIAQRFLGLEINVAGIITVNNAGRMAGTLGSPNTAAGYFSLLLAPSISLILAKTERWVKYLAVAASFLGVIGLVLTISRGGILAFAISLVILGLMIWVRGRIAPWTAFFVVFIATAVLTFGGFTLDQFIGIRENAALARIPLMEIAWRMIVDHPFLGVGANNYVMNIRNYLVPEIGQGFLYVVHNKFLLVWAETGLGGILSFIGFLGLTIWRGWKTWIRDIPVVSYLALGFAAAIAGQMTHMMVEIFDARSEIQALWIAAALLAAMERLSRGDIADAK